MPKEVILPPLGNQYLNILKYSSLGVATTYPGIIRASITIVNGNGQFVPMVIIWLVFFLGTSLVISAVVNYYDRRLKLVAY